MWIMKMGWTLFSAQSLLFSHRGLLTLGLSLGCWTCMSAQLESPPLSDRLSLIQYSIGTLHHYSPTFSKRHRALPSLYAWVHQSVVSFWMVTRLRECVFSTVLMKKPSPRWEKWEGHTRVKIRIVLSGWIIKIWKNTNDYKWWQMIFDILWLLFKSHFKNTLDFACKDRQIIWITFSISLCW